MNKSKKAKQRRETSRPEAFKGFAYMSKKSLNEGTLAAFLRKATKFPLQQAEIDKFVSDHKPEVTE
jgi:hypothetical protein